MKRNTIYLFRYSRYILLSICILSSSCRKLVEVQPPDNAITQQNVYSNDQTASAVLSGIYTYLSSSTGENFGLASLSKWAGLSADEFFLWSGADAINIAYFTNHLAAPINSSEIQAGHEFWNSCYPLLYICNSAIEGISSSSSLTPSVQQQLLGEAKFLRAFIYLHLVNLYGDVPLSTGTDAEVNRLLPRSSMDTVYKQIVADLSDAKKNLSSNFLNRSFLPYAASPERVRPTTWAASALLARVYLYRQDYVNAEAESNAIITNSNLFGLPTLSDVFLKNSREAIWQLQPVNTGWNTEDAKTFNLSADPVGLSPTKPVHLSANLLSAFEDGDNRRKKWVDGYTDGSNTYNYASKYKQAMQNSDITGPAQMSEYQMVLRLAEQYLIRAEAKANLNKLEDAVADLNVLRTRARMPATIAMPNPLPDIAISVTKTQLLSLILHERQVELFTEWGHRWFDLKRTGNINAVMSVVAPQKGGIWESTDQLYPIPYDEILSNPSLKGHQNPGY